MIPFFDTHYVIRRPRERVFDFLSDFERYWKELPEFNGSRLKTDQSPVVEGKVYWIRTEDRSYQFQTRLEVMEVEPPERFVYEYSYYPREGDKKTRDLQALSAKEGPMPWSRARVILTLDECAQGTRVRAQMHVFGVEGFFARWKVSSLKTACARAQKGANANMVRVAEKHLGE